MYRPFLSSDHLRVPLPRNADGGTWTRTKSPSSDFESDASAIPPHPLFLRQEIYYHTFPIIASTFFNFFYFFILTTFYPFFYADYWSFFSQKRSLWKPNSFIPYPLHPSSPFPNTNSFLVFHSFFRISPLTPLIWYDIMELSLW